eukprot:Opistho-2@72778
MHSVSARANALFAYSVTAIGVLTFACASSSIFFPDTTDAKMDLVRVNMRVLQEYRNAIKSDLALVEFDIDADMSPLLNWSTKMLFVYLVAEYKTEKNTMNQVTLWDKIIQRGEDAVIIQRKRHAKYGFF